MSEEKKKRGFQPGNQLGNRNGRPTQPKGKPVSSLRRTLSKLRNLESKSLENIEKSVNGQEVDKEVLSSSKWVVQQVVAVQKACVAEELAVHGIRADNTEEVQEEKEEDTHARFSLNVLPTPRDLQ